MSNIQTFIGRYWSDQKLAEVYAFNADGKMRYIDACGCFLGVTLADRLHTISGRDTCGGLHYFYASHLEGAKEAEADYLRLGSFDAILMWTIRKGFIGADDRARAHAFARILRTEMRRREQLRRVSIPPGAICVLPPKSEAFVI